METSEKPPLLLSAAINNTLGALLEEITAIDRIEASIAARKAQLIDQARQWAEIAEGAGSSSAAAGWSPEVRARRVLVTELASALRIPERTAETLIADSQALLRHCRQPSPP